MSTKLNRDEMKHRIEIIEVCRRMYKRGYVSATDGNISARLDKNRLLVSRRGVCKGYLIETDLLVCDYDGRPIEGGSVTSEILLHLAVYRARPEVTAVLHAHPPMAVACSLAGIDLTEPYLPEVLMGLGSVPTTQFAVPSSGEGALAIRDLISKHDVIILDRHGALCVGSDIWDAFFKLERLEYAAKVILYAKCAGKLKKLSSDQIARLKNQNH